MNLLRKCRIELNVESLMHLAIWEPASFKVSASAISHTSLLQALVTLTKQMAIDEHRADINVAHTPPVNVLVDTAQLTRAGPLARAKQFPLVPADKTLHPPRPLDHHEF